MPLGIHRLMAGQKGNVEPLAKKVLPEVFVKAEKTGLVHFRHDGTWLLTGKWDSQRNFQVVRYAPLRCGIDEFEAIFRILLWPWVKAPGTETPILQALGYRHRAPTKRGVPLMARMAPQAGPEVG